MYSCCGFDSRPKGSVCYNLIGWKMGLNGILSLEMWPIHSSWILFLIKKYFLNEKIGQMGTTLIKHQYLSEHLLHFLLTRLSRKHMTSSIVSLRQDIPGWCHIIPEWRHVCLTNVWVHIERVLQNMGIEFSIPRKFNIWNLQITLPVQKEISWALNIQ